MLTRSHKATLSLFLVASFAGCMSLHGKPGSVAPEADILLDERLHRVESMIQGYIDDQRLAGAVVHIAKGGHVVLHQAYGWRDREAADPMRTDDIFRIASQTKAIVSVGIMILRERGQLRIDEPVGQYLPEWTQTTVATATQGDGYDVVSASRPITIRDLLTHTSGIGYGRGIATNEWKRAGFRDWYFANREEPIQETVRAMADLPMQAQPGETFLYGYSTDVLGALIEVVSDEPLDVFLRREIFEPLAMDDTHFYLPLEKTDRLAVVYSADESGQTTRAPDGNATTDQGAYIDGPRTSFSGGAGLLSTAQNYGRFLQMLARGGTLDDRRVLKSESVGLMTSDQLDGIPFGPGMGFGLGFAINTDTNARGGSDGLGTYSWAGAYHTTYWVDPEKGWVVVYLTQLLPDGGLGDTRELRALINAEADALH